MQNIYSQVSGKLSSLGKKLERLLQKGSAELKKDFVFYNKHTELLAVWTLLFLTITGLFTIAINNNLFAVLLLLVLAITATLTITVTTVFYLHALKYHNKKRLLPTINRFLNKSFKLRSLLKFVKIPYASFFLSKIKNFKHLIKLNLKFAS